MSADIEKRMQGIEILLVEDSPTQVERLRHVMEAKGYRTRVARDGKKALEALRERKPNLVLSDIVMPEMDGYALCHAIKTDPNWGDIPVILVTSLVDAQDIVRGLECGADSFVRKPYADDYQQHDGRCDLANLFAVFLPGHYLPPLSASIAVSRFSTSSIWPCVGYLSTYSWRAACASSSLLQQW